MIIRELKKVKKISLKKIWIVCDKNKKEKYEKYEKRQTSSRKTNCSFEIVIVFNTKKDFWTYEIKISNHNHDFILIDVVVG